MHITDPVADMLTRIRNANSAKHETVDVPASNMKKSIAQILLDEGYIKNFQVVEDGLQGIIHITLKYNAGKEKVITGLRRVSKPGLRVYVGAEELPRVTGVQTCALPIWPARDMSAAKSWRSSGKEGTESCLESAECPLPSPPASPSTWQRVMWSPSRARRGSSPGLCTPK